MSRYNFTLGSDPEAFLLRTTDKKIVSAIGKVEGTKDAPVPIPYMENGFAMQADNVLVEFNIPPARILEEWVMSHDRAVKQLNALMGEQHQCKLEFKASHVMDDSELEDPRAHIFGCEPDFNVWTLENNPRPYSDNRNLRSAGGHVHIGMKGMSKMDKITLGRLLDWHLGLWSVNEDPDTDRRQLYGRAGSIRIKPYGIEYRTLSNFWLRSRESMKIVYFAVAGALEELSNNQLNRINKYGTQIITAINNSDRNLAQELRVLKS